MIRAAALALALVATPAAAENNERWWREADRCLAMAQPEPCWAERQAIAARVVEAWAVLRPDLVVDCQRYDNALRQAICIMEGGR